VAGAAPRGGTGPGRGDRRRAQADRARERGEGHCGPALSAGEAQLSWRDGGAEIDVEAIAEAALERFRTQLDGSLQRGT